MSRPRLLLAALLFAVLTGLPWAARPRGSFQMPAPSARAGFQVRLIDPPRGAPAFGPTRIRAEVKVDDPSRVLEVTFWVGDQKVFVDHEPPYETTFDFGSEGKSFVIRAVATHVDGYSVEDSRVTQQLRLSYTVEVRRVVLTLTVLDDQGAPLTGLGRDDFRILEDGKEQEILEFSAEQRPLRIGLVVDTSGSMRANLPQVQEAAVAFLDVLRPEDRAMVIDFNDQVMLLQDLTDSRESLRAALVSTFAGGGTALYDAVHAGLRRLARQAERKALVLLSDGGDTASVFDRDRAVQAARTSDSLIYAVGIGGDVDRGVLKSLAEETGGRAFFVDSPAELAAVYNRIAEELRVQYVITYASSSTTYDGKWRKVDVQCPGHPKATVRSRRGYYAVRPALPPL